MPDPAKVKSSAVPEADTVLGQFSYPMYKIKIFFPQSIMSGSLKNLLPEEPTKGIVNMYWGFICARCPQGHLV